MKIKLRVVGENHNEIVDRAEEMAERFAGDLPRVVKYGQGWTEQVDTRTGPRASFARAQDLALVFIVPIVIEVGDEPEADEEDADD